MHVNHLKIMGCLILISTGDSDTVVVLSKVTKNQ